MSTQTEAQRLADDAVHLAGWFDRRGYVGPSSDVKKYAAELLRLDVEITALRAANAELQGALVCIDAVVTGASATNSRDLADWRDDMNNIQQRAIDAITKHKD